MLKVLIVDDMQLKSGYLKMFIRENCYDCKVECVDTYEGAMRLLDTRYDLVLCDQFLGHVPLPGDPMKVGSDFLALYTVAWSESLCLLYSSDALHAKNQSRLNNFHCFSWDAIQTEVIMAIGKINLIYSSASSKEEVRQMGDPFNQALCDAKSKYRDEKENEMKKEINGIRGSIENFREDNVKQGRSILIAMGLVIITQIVLKIF